MHLSSCALYRLPAYFPMRCDCGHGHDARELWRYRLLWRRESGASWFGFLMAILRAQGSMT
jgi:hypothetical protein